MDDRRAAYRLAADLPGIEPVGLAVHIGSQIVDLGPSRAAFARIAEFVVALRDEGLAVRQVDLGGGLTIPYGDEVPATPAAYAAMVRERVRRARRRRWRSSQAAFWSAPAESWCRASSTSRKATAGSSSSTRR